MSERLQQPQPRLCFCADKDGVFSSPATSQRLPCIRREERERKTGMSEGRECVRENLNLFSPSLQPPAREAGGVTSCQPRDERSKNCESFNHRISELEFTGTKNWGMSCCGSQVLVSGISSNHESLSFNQSPEQQRDWKQSHLQTRECLFRTFDRTTCSIVL